MSIVDATWWRMDRPHKPMSIVGVLLLERRPNLNRLRAAIRHHLLAYPRFLQRPVQDGDGAWWEEDRGFRLSHHLVQRTLAGRGGEAGLRTLLARLISEPLDPGRPLWELTVIDNLAGRAALVVRIHHCYADGIALVQLLMSMTVQDPDSSSAPQRSTARAAAIRKIGPLDELLGMVRDLVRIADSRAPAAESGRRDPEALAAYYARMAFAVGKEVLRLIETPAESVTRLKGKPGPKKRIAWCKPLPVADVKVVARSFGCSTSEALLACLAGGLAGHLRSCGDEVREVEIRVLFPVNLRAIRQTADALGNHFGLVALELPLGIQNPIARAWEIHRRMEALKGSKQALLVHLLLALAGLLPGALQRDLVDALAAKSTAVVTNVPGPPKARYLAGARIDEMLFWVPQTGDIGLGVSILSYDGHFRIGIISDANVLPRPEHVISRVEAEFDRLPALARVLGASAGDDEHKR